MVILSCFKEKAMKFLTLFLACIGICWAISGCNKPQETTQNTAQTTKNEKFTVVTTFTVIADIAQNVAGDKAVVESITKAGAEIHDYEPTP